MADRISAEIWIGGRLPRSLLGEFPVSDLPLDWDANRLTSTEEEDVLHARDENGLLHFAEYEQAWGEFQKLEEWLREHGLPFRRCSGAKYEYSAERVEFRPDLQGKRNREVYVLTTPEGNDVVEVAAIAKITDRMAKLAANQKPPASRRVETWQKLFRQLVRILPPKLPPLPPFAIING